MISYLGSLVQFSPAARRAGRCRQISLCVGNTLRVPATLGLPRYRGVCAFPVYTAQAPRCSIWSGPCVECSSSFRVLHNSAALVAPTCCVFPGLSGSGSQRLARVLPGTVRLFRPRRAAQAARGLAHSPQAACLFPPRPQRTPPVGSLEVFRQELGPVCRVGGGGFSGAEFAPFPSPLPPTSSGDGLALLCSFSVPLFCEPPAVCSGQLIFPCSPTV